MKSVVKEWLEYAEKDLKAAELLISDPTGPVKSLKN
jgi:hypothetical protein